MRCSAASRRATVSVSERIVSLKLATSENPNIRTVYELVGKITTIWNQVEELWYLKFTVLMAETERAKVDAIYGMFQTGALQRQLIMTVAPIALKFDVQALKDRDPNHHTRRRLLKRIGRLNADTSALAGRRNTVIHTAFEVWGSRIVSRGGHKVSKLRDEKNVAGHLVILEEDVTLHYLDLLDLRDEVLDWSDPGGREGVRHSRQLLGLPSLEDARKAERERLLKAVALRKKAPPQTSTG